MAHIMFDLNDRRYWVYQPNIVRWRHRYKGPRESLKINQEIGQYYYDIKNADRRLDILDENFENDSSTMVDGGDVDTVQWNWYGDSTPSAVDMAILGFNAFMGRVELLRNRVKSLEGR